MLQSKVWAGTKQGVRTHRLMPELNNSSQVANISQWVGPLVRMAGRAGMGCRMKCQPKSMTVKDTRRVVGVIPQGKVGGRRE